MRYLVILFCLFYVANSVEEDSLGLLISTELLCPLCISVIERLKENYKTNPNLPKDLKASCESLAKTDQEQIDLCKTGFTSVKMEMLKTKSPKEICNSQKLCESNETKESSSADQRGVPDFATIPLVRNSIDEPIPGVDVVKKLVDFAEGKGGNVTGEDLTIHFDLKFEPPNLEREDANTTDVSNVTTILSSTPPSDS
ncbi:unnamed protein product [Anisakis simplex]|uniref:Saposin B-type domain-containing protein n=1 Tax=Anisakis simplex TaxID=6269 RepID=A0A0M3JU59_ANISI|nr:unnamed protein product [Anisakis simplex]